MNVKAKATQVARWFDAILLWLSRLGSFALSSVALIAALFAGSTYWFFKGPEARRKLLDTNKLSTADQREAVMYTVYLLAVVVVAVLVGYFAYARRKGRPFTWIAARIGAFLTPVLAIPFIAALADEGIEADKRKPFITLFFCACTALVAGVSAYRIARRERGDERDADALAKASRRAKVFRWLALGATALAVLGVWLAYGYFFTNVAITNHHAMQTRTIDLGAYDNVFYQSSHGNWLGCSFYKGGTHRSAHFNPILVVLSPLYLLYQRTEFLLGLQSFWCGSVVIPCFLLANHHLKSRVQALLIAICYALHPALHGANLYEFHSLTLAAVPITWTLFFLQTGRLKLYWLAIMVSLLVREDIPLMLAMVGVTAMLLPDGRFRRTGFFTIVISIAYFALVKKYFMTSSDVLGGQQSYGYGYYYADMIPDEKNKNLSGLLLSMVTNPTFALRHAFSEAKVLYLVTMFLPLLFLPFAVRTWRLTLLYGVLFTTLATRTAVFSTHFQYSTAILPFAFALAPLAIRQASEGSIARAYGLDRARLQRALVVAAFFATAATSYKFGGIFPNQSFRGGFATVVRKLSPEQTAHYAWLEETKKLIPPKATLGVTQKVGPHVSNRKDVFLYGQKTVQYIFVDEKEIKGDRLKRHKQALEQGKLETLAKRGSYGLYKFVKPKPKPVPQEEPRDPDDEEQPGDPRDVMGDDPQE